MLTAVEIAFARASINGGGGLGASCAEIRPRESNIHTSYVHLLMYVVPSLTSAHIERTMTRIAQIDDRGAALAWSPVSSHADVIALGTKVRD